MKWVRRRERTLSRRRRSCLFTKQLGRKKNSPFFGDATIWACVPLLTSSSFSLSLSLRDSRVENLVQSMTSKMAHFSHNLKATSLKTQYFSSCLLFLFYFSSNYFVYFYFISGVRVRMSLVWSNDRSCQARPGHHSFRGKQRSSRTAGAQWRAF